jgi:hypothetical protein
LKENLREKKLVLLTVVGSLLTDVDNAVSSEAWEFSLPFDAAIFWVYTYIAAKKKLLNATYIENTTELLGFWVGSPN